VCWGLSWTGAGDKKLYAKKHYGITATFLSSVSNLLYKGKWVPQNKKDDKEADDEEKYISGRKRSRLLKGLKDTGENKKSWGKDKKEQPPFYLTWRSFSRRQTKSLNFRWTRLWKLPNGCMKKSWLPTPEPTAGNFNRCSRRSAKVLNGIYKNPEYRDYVLKIKEMGDLKVTKSTKRYVDNSRLRTTMR